MNSENFKCADRGSIIGRAQLWVDQYVPFDSSQIHDGYRQDGGGYICMAWQAGQRPGLSLADLGTISHPISKDELQNGDILNCPSISATIFAGWADSSRSQYIGFELNSSARTIKRNIPYPYFQQQGCFRPIRYNDVC